MMSAPPIRLRVALVRRGHGVRGEVRVEPLGGDVRRFSPGTQLTDEHDGTILTVTASRAVAGGDVLLTFAEVADRSTADSLRGRYLVVDRDDARTLGANEFFVHDLVGMTAVDPDGNDIGTLIEVESYVGNDVLVIAGPSGERRFPMVAAFVGDVDVDRRRIVVTPWTESDG